MDGGEAGGGGSHAQAAVSTFLCSDAPSPAPALSDYFPAFTTLPSHHLLPQMPAMTRLSAWDILSSPPPFTTSTVPGHPSSSALHYQHSPWASSWGSVPSEPLWLFTVFLLPELLPWRPFHLSTPLLAEALTPVRPSTLPFLNFWLAFAWHLGSH